MPTVSFNTHFPGYDILGEISRSNARVLKARHVATGDLVAIKHFSLNTDADTLRRFERESEIMSQIAHPNIVRVREIRLDADLPYIVMEYVEGGSVRQLITESGCLSVETTIRLGLQVLDAFRAIHARGIVHRDIKPENILYHTLASGELHFLLADFGVARLNEKPVTVTGQSMMTYEYAAPEQFDNPRHVDASADYYALGVVLYECLTGHVPFAMRDETGIVTFMNAVLTTPAPTPVLKDRSLPESLGTLLRQMLAKNPIERIHNPDLVKLALKHAELEQLRVDHNMDGPAVMTTPAAERQPTNSSKSTARFSPPAQPDKPVTARSVVDHRKSGRTQLNPWYILLGLVIILLIGLGGYWMTSNNAQKPTTTSPSRDAAIDNGETLATESSQEDDLEQRIEAARQAYQQQVTGAIGQLSAETFGAKIGFFGGVKGLSIRLENPSPVTFNSVQVRVRYVKDNGGIFKTAVVTFNEVGPNATVTKRAPDSPRGTSFTAEVAGYEAAPFDSLSVSSTP